jgi:hypothetical protein
MLDASIPLETARAFGPVNRIDTGGNASYNGLVLAVQRRPAAGITLNANYTWSHCISDWWNSIANVQVGTTSWMTADRSHERGNCISGSADRRHVLNTSTVVEAPRFSNPALNAVASGWRLSTIFKVFSGSYLDIHTRRDPMLTGVQNQRIDQVLENVYGAKTVEDYLNPAAFRQAAEGTLPTLGRASVLGPGTWQFDLALTRQFAVGETQRIEVRAEAFNVTNSLRMENPDMRFEQGTFGKVRSARDPRIMQFALKYFF